MKRAVIAAAMIVTACSSNQGDSGVCTKIIDPPSSTSVENSMEMQRDPEWQRVRAEACVHRQAYRLATSPDPAQTVAKAVVVFCENPLDASASVTAHDEIEPLRDDFASEGEMNSVDSRIAEIKANFERFALSKVVEGRAGKCRA